jgi:hypothetical protein
VLSRIAVQLIADVPDPGQGKAPPGSAKLLLLLQWVAYVGYAVCVMGVIVAAAGMAVQHRHGTAGENGSRLGWVLAGALLIGAAAALVQKLA